MCLIKTIEKALETEHSAFIRLSQLCSELVQRFETVKNTKAANKIRLKLDKLTELWDIIVSGLEKHSEMVINLFYFETKLKY